MLVVFQHSAALDDVSLLLLNSNNKVVYHY